MIYIVSVRTRGMRDVSAEPQAALPNSENASRPPAIRMTAARLTYNILFANFDAFLNIIVT